MRRPLCFLTAVFAVFIYISVLLVPPSPTVTEKAEGRYVTLEGRAEWIERAADPSDMEQYLKLTLRDFTIESGIPEGIDLEVRHGDKALCLIKDDILQQERMAQIGASVRIRGKVKLFRRASNDGEYDPFLYNSCIRGYVFSLDGARITAYTREKDPLKAAMYNVRSYLSARIDEIYEDRGEDGRVAGSALKAILLGQTGLVDPGLKEQLQLAGIVHVLCISGVHISLLGMCVYRLLQRLRVPLPLSAGAAAAVILLYSVMTGMHTSCLRAVIMFFMQITSKIIGRTYDMLTAMSLAAVLILIEQPYYICSSGFLYSFGAVTAAGLLMPALPRFMKFTAIPLVTIPVQLTFYYTFPLYSVFLNVFVIALMPAVMGAGLAGAAAASAAHWSRDLFPFMASLLKTASAICGEVPLRILWLYERAGLLTQKFPFGSMIIGKPSAWKLPVYYLLILAPVLLTDWVKTEKLKMNLAHLMCSVAALALIFGLRYRAPLSFYMLDVGQGDAMAVMTGGEGGGLNILIDGGSSSRQMIGRYVEIPFLRYHGIATVDYCILTHDDSDHLNGILELIEESGRPGGIRIKNIALPSVSERRKGENYVRIEKMAAVRGIPVIYLSRGMRLKSGDFELECLHPGESADYEDANECSVVLNLKYGRFSALLTGDLEGEGERDMIRFMGGRKLRLNLFKAAHHGSRTASSEELLRNLSMDIALISCGRGNRYGHPAPETIERLVRKGAEILDTRFDGQISVRTDGRGTYSVSTFY